MKILNEYDVRKRIAKKLIDANIEFEFVFSTTVNAKTYPDKYKDAGLFIIKSKNSECEHDNINIRSNMIVFDEENYNYSLRSIDKLTVWGYGIFEYDEVTIDNMISRIKPIMENGIEVEYERENDEGWFWSLLKSEEDIDQFKTNMEKQLNAKIIRIKSFNGLIDKHFES